MSHDLVLEKVPKFTKRLHDYTVEGSNGTIIIMGTDRAKKGPAGLGDGLGHIKAPDGGKGSAAIHFIAGRSGEDPDMVSDSSFIYLSKKTDVDSNLGLESVESSQKKIPAAIVKSDSIRIIGRKDIKICSNDDDKHYVFMDGKKMRIVFGNNFIELDERNLKIDFGQSKISATTGGDIKVNNSQCRVVLTPGQISASGPHFKLGGGAANEWRSLLNTVMFLVANHGHMTAVGPSLPAGTSPGSISNTILGPVAPGAHPITLAQWPTAMAKLAQLGSQCFE